MIVVERIPETVIDHRVNHGRIVHAITETRLGQRIRCHRHILHTACDDDIRIARLNHLRRHVDAVQTGTTDNVHRDCRGRVGKTCLQCCLTRRVLTQSRLQYIAHVDMINLLRLHACSLQSLLDDQCAELHCRRGAEAAAHLTDCGAACACKNNFLRHILFLLRCAIYAIELVSTVRMHTLTH